jgi:hypothetical protein
VKIVSFIRRLLCIDRVWNVGFFFFDSIYDQKVNKWFPLKNEFYSFYADPFIFKCENNYYIFVEEFYYFSERGAITLIELDENLSFKSKRTLIKDNQHYSFPRIFSLNKKLYLSVENISRGKGFQYYELSQDMQIVNSFRLMIDYLVVDPILMVRSDGLFLSFNSDREICNYNKNSYLLRMTSLDFSSELKPTLVKSNLYGSRNAGIVSFSPNEETIYSQVSTSKIYGYSVVATDLFKNKKRENCQFLSRFSPHNLIAKKKYLGIHTINNCGSVFVFDFVEYKFNCFRFFSRLFNFPIKIIKHFMVVLF